MRGAKPRETILTDKLALNRVLTFWPLLFYGLGVIIGAGIYVALGTVLARAGEAAPFSFLIAGLAAAATGLCYAELAGRFPEAGGSVAYVRHAFESERLAQLAGLVLTATVAISAASIARGSAHYLAVLVPLPDAFVAALVVIAFTLVAVIGVRASVGFAALIGVIEIGGLLAATGAGLHGAPDFDLAGMLPRSGSHWVGVLSGAFIAFFAFTGFETLANLAEEVKEPRRTVPLGIVAAVGVSTVLYIAVAVASVLAHGASDNPLLDLFEGKGATGFALVGSLAVANGVLVQIVMLARLFYGMASKKELPARLARIHPRTQTPIEATVLAGAITLGATLLVPFEHLLVLADALTLALFALVDVALWRVQHRGGRANESFCVPRALPPIAAFLALALMLAELAL